ncbi:casein kinase 1-like protein [Trichophyton mentagrophytes]|nr:casein kinase 1-like protein [Trichophyton mentagrophytes]
MSTQQQKIYAKENVFRSYEALTLRFPNIYGARDIMTKEIVFLKFGHSQREINELNILRNLTGVPGVPGLRWSTVSDDHIILATDPYGPTVGELFSSSKQCLGLDTVLPLAIQMLLRLEQIHSRSIIIGGLSPEALAIGGSSWQQYQIFITNFERARKVEPNNPLHLYQGRRADLKALGMILVYLLGDEPSWDTFMRKFQTGTASISQIPGAVLHFINRVPAHGPVDYSTQRRVFQTLLSSNGFSTTLIFPGFPHWFLDKGCAQLHYDGLQKRIFETSTNPSIFLGPDGGVKLLDSLADVLEHYMCILLSGAAPPCQLRRPTLPRTYELPRRVWKDLLFYQTVAQGCPKEFQLAVASMELQFMISLIDLVPSYRQHWLDYVVTLAGKKMNIDGSDLLEPMVRQWRELYNDITAQLAPLASPHIISRSDSI